EQDKDLPLQDADDGKSSDENSEDDNSSDKEGEFEVEEIRGKRIHRGNLKFNIWLNGLDMVRRTTHGNQWNI
ncbi:MAG: hypothetical protein ACK5GV_13390, partial [Bacteroidota bacterium]